jgi:hypothetical protein
MKKAEDYPSPSLSCLLFSNHAFAVEEQAEE